MNRSRHDERRGSLHRIVVVAVACLAVGLVAGLVAGLVLGRTLARRDLPSTSMPGAASTSAVGLQLWTCGMHPQVIQDHPGACPICHMALVPLNPSNAATELVFDPALVQHMGVRTARIARGTSHRIVRAVGTIQERETDHADVTLRVTGVVDKLFASSDGMPVALGDPLFELDSPELFVAVGELIGARHEFERSADTAGAAGQSLSSQILDATRARLQQLGVSDDEIGRLAQLERAPRTITIRSPMDGHVTAKTIYAGSSVRPGDRVMRIANNRHMWLDTRVPQRDVGSILAGADVRARVDAANGETFTGKVLFVHPHLDMATRTALVRVELDNAGMELRENMWAAVEIVGDTWAGVPMVPREAVIDTGRRKIAFVSLGEGRFVARDVEVGPSGDEGFAPVIAGLAEGEEVVTSGQFLLDAESRTRDAIREYFAQRASAGPGTSTGSKSGGDAGK